MLTGNQFQLIISMLFIIAAMIAFIGVLVLCKLDNIHDEVIERINNHQSTKRRLDD